MPSDVKPPWYIDLLNLNLDNHDLDDGAASASRRYIDAFDGDGTRITENLDFASLTDAGTDDLTVR